MYYIWRCILFSAFDGRIHPPNQVHRLMCIYLGIIKLIRIKRQSKSTLNSQHLKFRQISYTLNIIRLQYCIQGHFCPLTPANYFTMCQIRPDTAVFMFKNYKKGICPVLNSHTDNGDKRGQNKLGAIMSLIRVSSFEC